MGDGEIWVGLEELVGSIKSPLIVFYDLVL